MANRGEHSELLALLRVLHQGKIQVADAKGKPGAAWLKVLSVSHPNCPDVRYRMDGEAVNFRRADGSTPCVVQRSKLQELAESLFREIADSKGASFKCKSAKAAAELLGLRVAKAAPDAKSDLHIEVASSAYEGESLHLGFSIKSEVGGLPTLLNAGATHFRYIIDEPEGLDALRVQENLPRPASREYPGPMKLVPALEAAGARLVFDGVENQVFEQNLKMIDTAFPVVLGAVLKHAYLQGETNLKRLVESGALASDLADSLGLPGDMVRRFVRHKIKDLLRQSALGMNPASRWEGEVEAHGGWIVVKADGGVVCFHLVNDDDFREFLLTSCKLETPAMKRHDAGYAYRRRKGDSARLRLSLQVRFA